jgi:mono/diheme cytochrome c family protein
MRPWRFIAVCALSWAGAFAQTPFPPEKIERGRQVYEQFCETCHGPGMVNPGTVSFDLRRFPTDAKERFTNSVTNGKSNGMPAWGRVIAPEDVESLWAYVTSGHAK